MTNSKTDHDYDEKNIGSSAVEQVSSSSEQGGEMFKERPGEQIKLQRQLKSRHISMIRYV